MVLPKTSRQALAVTLILSLIMVQTGCMSQPPSMTLHDELLTKRIALVPDRSGVEASLDFTVKHWPPEGGGGLLDSGMRAMGSGNVGSLPTTSGYGVVLLVALAAAAVGAVAIMAITDSFPEVTLAETVDDIESRMIQPLATFPAQLDLVQRALAHSRNVPGVDLELIDRIDSRFGLSSEVAAELRKSGFDKALAIKMTKLDYIGEQGEDPHLGLYIEAKASIVDLVSRETDYERTFYRLGKSRPYSEWLKVGPEKLVEDLNEGLDQLAGDIVTGLFVSFNLPIDSGRYYFYGMEDFGCCWICPVSPPMDIDYFNLSGIPNIEWSPVESLHPNLKWKAFPGRHRQEQFREKAGHTAENITYDLRIWDLSGNQVGTPVYERRKIASTSHEVEDELKPNTRYFWSFRACFDLGERQACTPWAFSLLPSAYPDFCENIVINPWNYYRFQTPE
jgi:hypothetical protein